MATVLDFEHEDQLSEVISWAEEASQYVDRVLIIPKVSGTLRSLPRSFGNADVILAYSVPTSYGGSPVPIWEFRGYPVHLLGGSPQKQMEISRYLDVVSVDGNMAHQQAHRCRFWRHRRGVKGHWCQLEEVGITDRSKGQNAVAFRMSLREIRLAWEKLI